MSPWARDLKVWCRRARECRHPELLASAAIYSLRRRRLLSAAARQPAVTVARYVREIEDDHEFLGPLRTTIATVTSYAPRAADFMMTGRSGSVFFNEVAVYALVRALGPAIVVETGGTPGKSSAFILRAMMQNGRGHLYTIDLPPPAGREKRIPRAMYHESRPAGLGSNWVVDDALRERQTLLVGSSRERLPPLLAELEHVDVFFHDSDHSYANMAWEFETAWPTLAPNGLLLSDDVLANSAFADFCRKASLESRTVFNLGAAWRR